MNSKIKSIIIFATLGALMIFVYVSFFQGSEEDQALLTSTSSTTGILDSQVSAQNSAIAQDFLSLLLNVKSISLQDSIFADPAFISLKDSSIELIPDGNEGRPNPFAPIGSDVISVPVTQSTTTTTTTTKEIKTGTTTTPPTSVPTTN
jgi:hypothetical protein